MAPQLDGKPSKAVRQEIERLHGLQKLKEMEKGLSERQFTGDLDAESEEEGEDNNEAAADESTPPLSPTTTRVGSESDIVRTALGQALGLL